MRMWTLERLRMFVMVFSVTVLKCHEIASKRTYWHRKQNDTSNCLQKVSTGKHDLKHMYCQCQSQLKEAEQNLTQSLEEWRLEAGALRNQTTQCLMRVAALQDALRTCELGTGLIDDWGSGTQLGGSQSAPHTPPSSKMEGNNRNMPALMGPDGRALQKKRKMTKQSQSVL